MDTQHRDPVHAAVARRTDPNLAEAFGTEPREVADLRASLTIRPGGTYAVEVKAFLIVEGPEEQRVWLAPFLVHAGRRRRGAWQRLPDAWRPVPPGEEARAFRRLEASGGVAPTLSWSFTGIESDEHPIDAGLLIKTNAGESHYDVGYLSARAIPSDPRLTVLPGLGPLVTLVGDSRI